MIFAPLLVMVLEAVVWAGVVEVSGSIQEKSGWAELKVRMLEIGWPTRVWVFDVTVLWWYILNCFKFKFGVPC